MDDPVVVELVRGETVESRHRAAIAVVDADGKRIAGWGDVHQPVFPRSAVKPLQALPLIESGAADAFGLGDAEIALACASHTGRPEHVDRVRAWLGRIGLGPEALECGAHAPTDAEAAAALHGRAPEAVHNNCSGKHAGFLSTAVHFGEPIAGYIHPDHPVQRRVTRALLETCKVEEEPESAIDGCGIPTLAIPLSAMALGFARLAAPETLEPTRQVAAARVIAAMRAHPELTAGPGRLATDLMRAAPQVVAKGGAEGVYAACLPGRGIGIAFKVADGAARAADVLMVAVLERIGALTMDQRLALTQKLHPPVRNAAGRFVGELRPAMGWFRGKRREG